MVPDEQEIHIDQSALVEARKSIPPEDFANRQFDCPATTETTDVLFLLSTPRCGSTFLADLIRRADWCLPHEYFQHFEYLPILANRWGCIRAGVLDKNAYVTQLCAMRTYSNGWLGINLHGNHLATFAKFSGDFPSLNEQYIHLRRRDRIAQAVSYEIAAQTGKWSSHFQAGNDATYSFEAIRKRIQIIEEQELKISSYLQSREASCATIYYEELIEDPEAVLGPILTTTLGSLALPKSDLSPQASQINLDWAQRFAKQVSKKTSAV